MLAPNSVQKQKLRAALVQRGWEILETSEGLEWWIEEEWRIRSIRESWGFEVRIVYRIDDYPTSHISEIEAHDIDGEGPRTEFATLSYRNHFHAELPGFLDRLDEKRRRGPSLGSGNKE